MAELTVDGLGELTSPAANDEIGIWDVSAGQYLKIRRDTLVGGTITGGGTIATGGFTLTVPATGTAALKGTDNAFSVAQTMAAGINVGVAGALLSLYADGVIRQALDGAMLNNDATLAISSRARGLVYVDVAAIALCALYLVDNTGSTLVAGNATYFGTAAGTASKFNVYNNAGQLTLQNKYGSVSTVLVMVIG